MERSRFVSLAMKKELFARELFLCPAWNRRRILRFIASFGFLYLFHIPSLLSRIFYLLCTCSSITAFLRGRKIARNTTALARTRVGGGATGRLIN